MLNNKDNLHCIGEARRKKNFREATRVFQNAPTTRPNPHTNNLAVTYTLIGIAFVAVIALYIANNYV